MVKKRVSSKDAAWNSAAPALKRIFSDTPKFSTGKEFIPHVKHAISRRQALIKSADKYGTPQYALDEALLARQARLFRDSFRKHIKQSRFLYAFKSNDLPYMIRKLKSDGFDADVASMFELMLALRLGFSRIIFTAPVKSAEEIRLAVKNAGKVIINVDNLDEIDGIISAVDSLKPEAKVRVSFRLRPEGKSAWSKFGLSPAELKKAVKKVLTQGSLAWHGVHFHSSWNLTPDAHAANIRMVGRILGSFPERDLSSLRFVDIGGGFLAEGSGTMFSATRKGSLMAAASAAGGQSPAPLDRICVDDVDSIDVFASAICCAFRKHIMRHLGRPDLELWAEPGRYISSIPTCILLKVVSVRDGRVFVDGGINLLGSASFEYEFFPVVNLSRPSLKMKKSVIYGPLCDPDDRWGSYVFSRKCRKGDVLAVLHQGAYTFSTAWRWQRPTAEYVAVSGRNIKLVKKEEEFSQRYAGCMF
ncbi:hypothetical protein JW898_03245 [Candidatus Woesearchaeota archaeon]|nr:hypothetical protein [Candidatus Woesearchaeota archaeon]